MTSKSLSPVQICILSLLMILKLLYSIQILPMSLRPIYSTLLWTYLLGSHRQVIFNISKACCNPLLFILSTIIITQVPNHKLWHHSKLPLCLDCPHTVTKSGAKCTLLFSQPPWLLTQALGLSLINRK